MYFKQIDLFGFKSFADRTHVRLEPGITCIVGPNGCGKSNILDALRWALGEQSAKSLRGVQMQDVIFNGSENRTALGMAEVSITFDNTDNRLPIDYSEVQVTRRLYRTGESEYLLNKSPCRLRDVQELFMDTGIGTNAYSLIGQGKIDLVLSSKPEDRRFLFEEAAGIIKYKSRKRVAMRKLDAAEQNLLRLNDIIAEVERQMRSLKRQVNAAVRYRELTDLLKALEVRAFWIKYAHLQQELMRLREQYAAAAETYARVMAENADAGTRNEELSLRMIEVERVMAARQESVQQLDAEMEKIERQIALLRQQIKFIEEQHEQALNERDEFRRRADEIQAKIRHSEKSVETITGELEACQKAIAEKQAEYDAAAVPVSEAESRQETERARAMEAVNTRAKAQTELETLSAGIRRIDSQLEAIAERHQAHHDHRKGVVERLEDARRLESEKQAALTAVVHERREAAERHAAMSQDVRKLNDEWQNLRESKGRQEARLHSLRELRDSYEGFAVGVRAIMIAKQRNMPEANGVIGPVGDLLATEKKFERAIEAALGGNINNIVVEEAVAAKDAIEFLKKHQAGRVTFLPLDIIRPNPQDDAGAINGMPGVIGPAIRFVQYDAHIRQAVEYLMHNTVIVETMDDAIRIARSGKRYPRLVTLEGEVVSQAGAVTGGRTQNEGRGLLGRSAEIAELEDHVKTADANLAKLIKRTQALAVEINDLARKIKEFESREIALRNELNEAGVIIARHAAELDGLQQSVQQLDAQRAALESERGRLEEQRNQALARADSMDQDDAAIQQALAEAQDVAARARQALAERTGEMGDLRVRFAELSQRLDEADRNRRREQQEYEEAVRNAERRLEQTQQLKQNQASLESEIERHLQRARALSEDADEARKKVVEARNEYETLRNENEALAKSLREMHDRERSSQSEVHRLEMALRHDEDQAGFLEERILAEYHVALSSLNAETVGKDEYDDETREKLIADAREKLERMGQVNLMAIEEYAALEQRHNFLVAQEEDLRKAREALLGVVERIDTTIRDMFLETFNNVADSFRNYFRRLFNGGQARIYLVDENDPLESGIEIEARPPGKKPQSISLLSGGEAAMTAIALLFSIFRAKPSPFCVLDEVDAPLDDANIGRFLDMVQEFTAESQFIIITHSKQTMTRANILYGVTMQERGVSQIVSVKFE